jgi:hypothetical protein
LPDVFYDDNLRRFAITGPERGFMTDQHAQAAEAIRESWDFWLSEHPGTLSEIVTEAVTRRTCIHDVV